VACERAEAAGEVAGAFAAAVRAALGASSPALLELPTDVLDDPTAPTERPSAPAQAGAHGRSAVAGGDLGVARELVAAAQRPLVWAGGGARFAEDGVRVLAEALGAPVLTTYGALGLLGHHELALGVAPQVAQAGALWDAADLVIAVGSDLDAIDTQGWRQPQPPALIAVNRDPADATKNYPADVVVARDAAQCGELAPAGRRAPWADVPAARAAAIAAQPADARALLAAFDEVLAPVFVDMCLPGYWLMGFHRPARPRSLHTPLGWGTLGHAFPAALGAACAGAGPVVSVSGDGGFLFACGELATMAAEQPPLTAVIVDDQAYGMLRVSPGYDEPLPGPDFAALAAAFGVRAQTVEGLGIAFAAALAAHVADPAPSVLVAKAPSLPASPTTSPRWYRLAADAG
jgi:acetolactate synthase-1/2/3 large subunit